MAGGTAIAHRARELLRAGEPSAMASLAGGEPGQLERIDAHTVAAAAAGGDGLALRLLDEVGGYLGRGLAAAANLLNPDTIVLGGMVGEAISPFVIPAIQRELRARSLPGTAAAVRVIPGALGEAAAIIGAAALALEQAPLLFLAK